MHRIKCIDFFIEYNSMHISFCIYKAGTVLPLESVVSVLGNSTACKNTCTCDGPPLSKTCLSKTYTLFSRDCSEMKQKQILIRLAYLHNSESGRDRFKTEFARFIRLQKNRAPDWQLLNGVTLLNIWIKSSPTQFHGEFYFCRSS